MSAWRRLRRRAAARPCSSVPNTIVKTMLKVRWKRRMGSAKVSECCSIAAATHGWASCNSSARPAPKKTAASPSTRQVIDRGPNRPASEPAACRRSSVSSRSRSSAWTISVPTVSMAPIWYAMIASRSTARRLLDEGHELARVARVAQLRERLCLDLPNALARDAELLADLGQRAVIGVADAEAQAQDMLLTRRELGERLGHGGLQRARFRGRVRIDRVGRLDQVAQRGIAVLADRQVERRRLLHHREDLLDARQRNSRA